MKAFVLSLIAAGVISVGANQVLQVMGFSSAASGTSQNNVRISE
jgi:hypothetical protein